MAHMQFDAAIDGLVKLDGPMQSGPVPRWQRKAKENATGPIQTTPRRRAMLKSLGRSPLTPRSAAPSTARGGAKSPGRKSPGSKIRKKSGTQENAVPAHHAGDRFIPNRALMDMDKANHLLAHEEEDDDEDANPDEASDKYRQAMKDRLMNDGKDAKILTFKKRAPKAQEGNNNNPKVLQKPPKAPRRKGRQYRYIPKVSSRCLDARWIMNDASYYNNLKVLYSASKTPLSKGPSNRFIPIVSDRILDAPYLRDDYYLTLIDWGPSNHVAVALDSEVYLWNAGNAVIECLLGLEQEEEYVSCVSWVQQGCILAVGLSNGEVQLLDVEQKKLLRSMRGHPSRVGALAWNEHVLASGSRTGKIHYHDVRVHQHHLATLDSHTQEVCGLTWSADGKYLASGGNDNMLNIWEYGATTSLFNITQHQAAVKALAWCPWQANVLASGGGTADRTICFWNASSGHNLNSVDTGSQVSSILWSEEHKKVISSHGYSQFQLTIWKYPTMAKLCNLTGHTSRVLSMCMSPDKTTVMSCAADETLRLWKCFMPKENKKSTKTAKKSDRNITNTLSSMRIR